ncbi:MAG: hypothetical protein HC923_08825 [Myxococcales bacterium]|nr:hypothetical protein [Myxococcales bacterium]
MRDAFAVWMGRSPTARYRFDLPGLSVRIQGDPKRASRLATLVRSAIEADPAHRLELLRRLNTSQVVLPSDLDERDAPYALPVQQPRDEQTDPSHEPTAPRTVASIEDAATDPTRRVD